MQIHRQTETEIQTRIVMKGVQMDRRNTVRVKRIAMIMSALMLMLLLCGCRTRVTNNTEVTNVLEDGGMMQESYQVRRDELGIPVAETPLFKGWNSGDEEYDDYYDYDEEFSDFGEDEEDYEDYEEEEDDPYESRRTDSTTTNTTNRPQHQPVTRPSGTQTELVKVTLDVNAKDAVCGSSFIMVRKGATYGALPEPSRSGYNFKGWYTAKKDGNKVSSDTKLKSDKAHTLYAHWKKAEKKTYTVSFDGNAEDDEVTLSKTEKSVEEDGKYGKLPSAKRKKYTFKGWYTDPEGGSQVTSESKFTVKKDQTLYAHWEYDPYSWWDSEFSTAANDIDESVRVPYVIDGGDDTEDAFVKDCKGVKTTDDTTPAVIIKFIKNYDEETAAEEAGLLAGKYKETAPGARIVIISDKALKGSKEEKLLYKMMLFDALYNSADESTEITDDPNTERINEAAGDLLDKEGSIFYPYIYTGGSAEDASDVPSGDPSEEQGGGEDIVVIDDGGDVSQDGTNDGSADGAADGSSGGEEDVPTIG